ncbi:hypothetical protein KO507_03785 [Gilvimarinus agarilyticus]|uniref:Class IIb bacteriocin, lactobin A/cerein 7B family n=1 Tax=Reichenbachiella agariperforans TaxID=156994 RepID=A0A1M6RWN1_REIAG|nr:MULTISPECIES: hypothetical protein [Reichenbachiella]MBU2884885.1 hypothetical protein [Gilvimarinus agarilyticus]MBU2914984.1 hypothetical protein [Reichenbachiella agariperforans]SHK36914.1 hypothetical protein SAMN04488028_104321 [Reichenbachiella agariperforans]
MNTIKLNEYGLESLAKEELQETNGGLLAALVGGFAIGVLVGWLIHGVRESNSGSGG